jgi:acetyl esterase
LSAPVLDRTARRFLDALNRTRAPGAPTVASLRAAANALAPLSSPAPEAARTEETLGALRLRVYSPPRLAGERLPGLVYFHGGGLVAGDLDTHDSLAAWLASAGCRVIAVDYARAPEAKFPRARDDAIAATLGIAREAERFRLSSVGVGGDSAGGQLAALAARAARDAGVALTLQLLLCPVMDCLARAPSRFALAEGYLLDEATMRAYWDAYRIEGLSAFDASVAPLAHEDFSGLAPALVHVAEGDPLCDEGAEYAERLAQAGVSCRLTRHAGLIHHFYGLGAVIPAARDGLAEIVANLKAGFADWG